MKINYRILIVCLALVTAARAQVNPAILISPWSPQPHWAETVDEISFYAQTETQNTKDDLNVWRWDSSGRVKLNRATNAPVLVIGYKINMISVRSDLGAINNDLADLALVAGGQLGKVAGAWELSALGGAGTANDGHFSNSDAIYGIGALQGRRQFDTNTALTVGIWYDGNRVFMPDIPFPYFLYMKQVNPQLLLAAGLPYNRVIYRPVERVVLDASVGASLDGQARITWHCCRGMALFAEYKSQNEAFAVEDMDNRRLLYQQRRVLGGVKVGTKFGDISLGGGYALNQDFDIGFDSRSPDGVAALRDQPFVMFRVDGKF
jgi:hypothetical protein